MVLHYHMLISYILHQEKEVIAYSFLFLILKKKMAQGGPAVETLIYDVVLEAAMRAQNFHARNLHINGPWNCLLTEFCTFYSVSDSYKTLR